MNKGLKTQKELESEVAMMIDKASFRQCYERLDPTIKFVVIISPEWPMAELAASLLEGGSGTKTLAQLAAEGVVKVVPPIFELLDDCNNPGPYQEAAIRLRHYLAQRIDHKVKAYYCPPGYFVQFTGQHWK